MPEQTQSPLTLPTRNSEYWTTHDVVACARATSFLLLSAIALRVLGRMPQPVGEVCGPVSTGGRGSIEANLAAFDETITQLMARGEIIFDQIPFEAHIFRVIAGGYGERQNNQLLTNFYQPIFESGLVKKLFFLPDWQSSHGATWEHEQARRLGIHVTYL